MPMIDVYAAVGTVPGKHTLARDLAAAVMRWEQVPDLPLFSNNTAAFIHEMDPEAISNVAGDSSVRVRCSLPPACSCATNNSASSKNGRTSSPLPPVIKLARTDMGPC